MDEKQFDAINLEQFKSILVKGGSVFNFRDDGVDEYKTIGDVLYSKFATQTSFKRDTSDLLWLLKQDWYIKKPFDVRQAMREREDEWVGVHQDEHTAELFKVGFDTNKFRCVCVEVTSDAEKPSDVDSLHVGTLSREELNTCISIEEYHERNV